MPDGREAWTLWQQTCAHLFRGHPRSPALEADGRGLLVPFADATSGKQTYGAGRHLLDTVNGAYLPEQGGELVMDFNFAYQPSWSYDSRWTCPLTPPLNRLRVPIRVGEALQRPNRCPSDLDPSAPAFAETWIRGGAG
jgi:uncharacterized protein (DUF1684 family)